MRDFSDAHQGAPAGYGAPSERIGIRWLMPAGMVGLSIYNFVLRILTLGVHHFWGKTEVRRRIWSAVRLNGEPLEYTGTGGELFTGFLIVFGVVLLPVLLVSMGAVIAFGPGSTAFRVFNIALYVFFAFLTGVAIYRAQRYRLNRTRWRGIRAGLTGSSLSYGWTYFWTLLLIPLTLGWIAPWRSTRLQRTITSDMRFGTMPFSFSANAGQLYKPFALFWVLTAMLVVVTGGVLGGSIGSIVMPMGVEPGEAPPTPSTQQVMRIVIILYGTLFLAGLVYMVLSAWYRASMMRLFARSTHIDGLTFSSSVTARGLLGITITNYLLMVMAAMLATIALAGLALLIMGGLGSIGIDPLGLNSGTPPAMALSRLAGPMILIFVLSLGLLTPYTQARLNGYLIRHLSVSGSLDTAAIARGAEDDIRRGEGLAQAFDIDAI